MSCFETIPRVSGVQGQWMESVVDRWNSSWIVRTRSTPSALSTPFAKYGSKKMTFHPNAFARRAAAAIARWVSQRQVERVALAHQFLCGRAPKYQTSLHECVRRAESA